MPRDLAGTICQKDRFDRLVGRLPVGKFPRSDLVELIVVDRHFLADLFDDLYVVLSPPRFRQNLDLCRGLGNDLPYSITSRDACCSTV